MNAPLHRVRKARRRGPSTRSGRRAPGSGGKPTEDCQRKNERCSVGNSRLAFRIDDENRKSPPTAGAWECLQPCTDARPDMRSCAQIKGRAPTACSRKSTFLWGLHRGPEVPERNAGLIDEKAVTLVRNVLCVNLSDSKGGDCRQVVAVRAIRETEEELPVPQR